MADIEDRDSYHSENEKGDNNKKEDYDEEDEDDEDEDHDKPALTAAMTAMEHLFKQPKQTQEDIDNFIKNNDIVTKSLEHHGSFLHWIISRVSKRNKSDWDDPETISPLIETLVSRYPNLLTTKNEDGQTPLYYAIRCKRWTFGLVDSILKASKEENIHRALETTCNDRGPMKTCLTKAFETLGESGTAGKSNTLYSLIEKSSFKALAMPDGTGKSPFHFAVKYNQCTDGRVILIKELLDQDSAMVKEIRINSKHKPLNTFLDLRYTLNSDRTEYSVYTEHERTKSLFESDQARKERESKQREAAERTIANSVTVVPPAKDKDPPKSVVRDKGPKSSEDRERGGKKPDRDRDFRKQPEPKTTNDSEKKHQQPKEQDGRGQEIQQAKDDNMCHQDSTLQRKDSGLGNEGPKNSQAISNVRTSHLKTPHAPNSPVKRSLTGSKGIELVKKGGKKSNSSKTIPPEILKKNSKRVCELLKLHYMRTRGIREVTSFLYGKNRKDVHISFDCIGHLSKTYPDIFLNQFGETSESGIVFDNVLMYARFPVVHVDPSGRLAPKPRARGRQDMEFFSEWLKRKGVERIVTLRVEEDDQNPHSDESIQTVLRNFTVEHLDWQKPDLDPFIICETADIGKIGQNTLKLDSANTFARPRKDLRRLTLRWSGSNAALRAWSEPTGLPQLLELKNIDLHIPAVSELYDHRNWIQRSLKLFQARLDQNSKANQPSKKPDSQTKGQDGPGDGRILVTEFWDDEKLEYATGRTVMPKSTSLPNAVDEHEWIRQMEEFSTPMKNLWEETLRRVIDARNLSTDDTRRIPSGDIEILDALRKDVVVALIDDGVDTLDEAFSNQFVEGKTFDYRSDDVVGQYYVSTSGHGTDMGRMILKVCPMARIYSIKLKTHPNQNGQHLTIDESSIAPAIETALEKEADMISMSWTVPVPDKENDNTKRIDKVLGRACKKETLMFCSASDQPSETKHYPSHGILNNSFLIGAADSSGTADNYAGPKNDFVFPGVNVYTGNSHTRSLSSDQSAIRTATGSSIATALAAGLASMVTYCFKASALAAVTARMSQERPLASSGTELVKPQDVDRIARYYGMRKVFERIGTIEGGKFVAVWGRFKPVTNHLKDSNLTYEEKITHVMELCRDLMDRMD